MTRRMAGRWAIRLALAAGLVLSACSAVARDVASPDAASAHPARVGQAPPDDSLLGGAVDSGVAGFARPEGMAFFSKPVIGDPYITFTMSDRPDREGLDHLDDLEVWLAAVYPAGEDLGSWAWCAESGEAAMSGEAARRYAHPQHGAVTIEVLTDFGYPVLMIRSEPDGTCDLGRHP